MLAKGAFWAGDTPGTPPLAFSLGAAFLVSTVIWLLVARDVRRAARPAHLLGNGQYVEARNAAEQLGRTWMRRLRGVRLSARYTIACALHLQGELEASLAELRGLGNVGDSGLRYAILSLEAANLVMLEREPARAIALLREAMTLHVRPEDELLLAHANLLLGDRESADAAFGSAGDLPSPTDAANPEERQRRAIFHALRGLYLLRVARTLEGARSLTLATEGRVSSVYADRARKLLPRESAEDQDPRSSLAPQLLE